MEVVEIPCAVITMLDVDIFKVEYRNDYRVELKDAIELDRVFVELSQGAGIYTLLDTSGKHALFSKEAQRFLAKEGIMVKERRILDFALVIDNLPNRLLAKFYITFFKPKYPIKIFPNVDSALAFLKACKKRDGSIPLENNVSEHNSH